MFDVIATLARDYPRDFVIVLLEVFLGAMVFLLTVCFTACRLYEARCHHVETVARIARGDGPGPDKPPASPGWGDSIDG